MKTKSCKGNCDTAKLLLSWRCNRSGSCKGSSSEKARGGKKDKGLPWTFLLTNWVGWLAAINLPLKHQKSTWMTSHWKSRWPSGPIYSTDLQEQTERATIRVNIIRTHSILIPTCNENDFYHLYNIYVCITHLHHSPSILWHIGAR